MNNREYEYRRGRRFGLMIAILGFTIGLLMAGLGNAWTYTDATNRNNVTAVNITGSVSPFPFPIIKNFSGFTNGCISFSLVNTSDNEKLPYTMENGTCLVNNLSVIWARAVNITGPNTAIGYLYSNFLTPFDNSTQYGVFDSSIYASVLHMDNDQGIQFNAVPKANTTSCVNCYTGGNATNGVFGRALGLPGNATQGQGLKLSNIWSTDNGFNTENFTVEIWFNSTLSTTRGLFGYANGSCEIGINPGQGSGGGVRFYAINSSTVIFDNLGVGTAPPFTPGYWEYWVFSYDGRMARIYKNGVLGQAYSRANAIPLCIRGQDLHIGSSGSGGVNGFNGLVDEFRISPLNLSASYIFNVFNTSGGKVSGSSSIALGPSETRGLDFVLLDPENLTYINPNRSLNVSTDQGVTAWFYKLNGGGQVFFSPNTTFLAQNGANLLEVYANATGVLANRNVTFTINNPVPTISIVLPANVTYTTSNRSLVTAWSDNDPSTFWYILDGGSNITFNQNTTFLANDGSHTISVYLNDTSGSLGSSSVSFSINTTVPPTPPSNATTTIVGTTDPNVLLFLVIFFLVIVGLYFLVSR